MAARTSSPPRCISRARIRAAARRVALKFHPKAIVLFGSQATGKARPDSDVDWLVIAETRRPLELAARILTFLDGRFPLDVLVRTPREVGRALRGFDPFVRNVMASGLVLHDARRARVG